MQDNFFSSGGSIKACQIGAVTAREFELTSPPKFSQREVAGKLLRLPDGRVVSVACATDEEFAAFVQAKGKQIAEAVNILIAQIKAKQGMKKATRIYGIVLQIETLIGGLPEHPDMLDKWHTLLELTHAIGNPQSKYHVDVALFEESREGAA